MLSENDQQTRRYNKIAAPNFRKANQPAKSLNEKVLE